MSKRIKLDDSICDMESAIIDALQHLKYEGELNSLSAFKDAVTTVGLTTQYKSLVVWLCSQIQTHCQLKENVPSDNETFVLDSKGFVRELGCPYTEVLESKSLETIKSRLLLLDYLISELEACRLCLTEDSNKADEPMTVETVATCMEAITDTLKLPTNSTFPTIHSKLSKLLSTLPTDHLPPPLMKKPLTQKQWEDVFEINDILSEEYRIRRETLIKRLDVTVESFTWSDRMKKRKDEVEKTLEPIRTRLEAPSFISVAEVLAAREDMLNIKRTSSGEVREHTKCQLNKHMIGKVPDRGGRPSSVAPPSDMPSFKARQNDPNTGRGGYRGGRGGYRGGRGDNRGAYHSNRGGGGRGGESRGGWRGGRGGAYKEGGGRTKPAEDKKMYYS